MQANNNIGNAATVTILGCGCSFGVPRLGCNCHVCVSTEPKNRRQRSAVLIEYEHRNVLIDCGPDIKQQLLAHNINKIDALIITHRHYDHVSGLNELRAYEAPIDVYTTQEVAGYLKQCYPYMFRFSPFQLKLKLNIIDFYDSREICGLKVQTFHQEHAPHHGVNNIGIKIGDFVYANDVVSLSPKSQEYLYDVESLVLDCKDYSDGLIHIGLETVMSWAVKFKPKHLFLTNMSHTIEYTEIIKILQKESLHNNIMPCYDGMKIEVSLQQKS